jgi:hypothetical protein
VLLEQQAPGEYSGDFDASGVGTYIVTVAEPNGNGASRTTSRGFSLAYPPEYRSYWANRPLLERASAIARGRELTKPVDALRPVPIAGESITDLWMVFVLAAALLLPFDIGVRRIALPLGEILARSLAWIQSKRSRVSATPHDVAVDRLKEAKMRAQRPAATASNSPIHVEAQSEEQSAVPTTVGGSASTTLLDAKRRRKGE